MWWVGIGKRVEGGAGAGAGVYQPYTKPRIHHNQNRGLRTGTVGWVFTASAPCRRSSVFRRSASSNARSVCMPKRHNRSVDGASMWGITICRGNRFFCPLVNITNLVEPYCLCYRRVSQIVKSLTRSSENSTDLRHFNLVAKLVKIKPELKWRA